MRNITYFVLNFICLLIALVWMFKSNFEHEPIIVVITLVITLFFTSPTTSNSSYIKGSGNIVTQRNTPNNDESKNDSRIIGDRNDVSQS